MNVPVGSRFPSEHPKTSTDSPGHQATVEAGAGESGVGPSKFRWRKVLMVVVPVAVLALAVVAVVGLTDTDAILSDLARPPLVPASGQVLYQGKPLLNGQITTYPVSGRGLPALGWTDSEGRFTLKTDIRGNYVDGATVGEHGVTVAVFQPAAGPGAPALLTPQQYASQGTSPLRITVERNAEKNEFKLALEGEPASRSSGPANSKQGPLRQRAPKQGSPKQGSPKQDTSKQDNSKPGTPNQPAAPSDTAEGQQVAPQTP